MRPGVSLPGPEEGDARRMPDAGAESTAPVDPQPTATGTVALRAA